MMLLALTLLLFLLKAFVKLRLRCTVLTMAMTYSCEGKSINHFIYLFSISCPRLAHNIKNQKNRL